MVLDLGINERLAQHLERSEGALFVAPHQSAVAGYVGRKNGGQPPLHALFGHAGRPACSVIRWSLWLAIEGVYRGNNVR